MNWFIKRILKALWLPLLSVLSNNFNDIRLNVREKSLDTLFSLLRDYGYTFSNEFWKMIISGVIKSLFNEIHLAFLGKSIKNDEEKLRIICQKCFSNLGGLLQSYYSDNIDILDDILDIFLKSSLSNHEVIFNFSILYQFCLITAIS